MRLFYLRQRKPGGNFHFILMDAVAQRQIATRSTGTGDQKKAEAIAQEWLANGLPENQKAVMFAKTTSFCDFLHNFWDFKTSDYFKELKAMGKEPHLDHSVEMQRCVARYYRGYFKTKLLIQIDEETLKSSSSISKSMMAMLPQRSTQYGTALL